MYNNITISTPNSIALNKADSTFHTSIVHMLYVVTQNIDFLH